MAKVTANGREIACKARPGTSLVFPDVCFTLPPPPPPTGAPIPYPNAVFGPTLTFGTLTVFKSRKTMAVILRVYFSTSVGDEPAMSSPKRGIITNSVKGTGRFASCSFNVLFEFFPVCRHLDVVTHNHLSISPVPNTLPMVYMTGKGKGKKGQCNSKKCKIVRGLKKAGGLLLMAGSAYMTAESVKGYADTMSGLAGS